MPAGKTHNLINIIALPLLLLGLYLLSSGYLKVKFILIFTISYLFSTFFLSPDMDIESSSYERWGIFRFLWWPYKVLFKHRGISHNIVFGPLTILANLALIFVPLLLLAGIDIRSIPSEVISAIILGIVLSNELHIIADKVSELY